jgi:ferredoxin
MSLISVDHEKCNQDGICVSECPARIIVIDAETGYPVPTPDFKDFCLKCGHCVTVCPTEALRLDWLAPEECPAIMKERVVSSEQAEQFLRGRRSIRSFKEKQIPRDTLEKLIEVACSAPSAKNQQPWHWIVVQKPAEVRRIAEMVIDAMRMLNEDESTGGGNEGSSPRPGKLGSRLRPNLQRRPSSHHCSRRQELALRPRRHCSCPEPSGSLRDKLGAGSLLGRAMCIKRRTPILLYLRLSGCLLITLLLAP